MHEADQHINTNSCKYNIYHFGAHYTSLKGRHTVCVVVHDSDHWWIPVDIVDEPYDSCKPSENLWGEQPQFVNTVSVSFPKTFNTHL